MYLYTEDVYRVNKLVCVYKIQWLKFVLLPVPFYISKVTTLNRFVNLEKLAKNSFFPSTQGRDRKEEAWHIFTYSDELYARAGPIYAS